MRVIAQIIASKSTEHDNNHENNINRCNDEDGTSSINSCICLHKKVKRALSGAEKEDHVTIGRPLA